jgi:hypothetical protein
VFTEIVIQPIGPGLKANSHNGVWIRSVAIQDLHYHTSTEHTCAPVTTISSVNVTTSLPSRMMCCKLILTMHVEQEALEVTNRLIFLQYKFSIWYETDCIENTAWFSFTTRSVKKNLWSESASELYRPSDSRLSAKWLPTFADKGCHVVSVTDPYGRILDFLDRSRYFSIK